MEIKTSNLVNRLIIGSFSTLHADKKPSLKAAWSGHVNHRGTYHISGAAEARVVKFCPQVGHVESQPTD